MSLPAKKHLVLCGAVVATLAIAGVMVGANADGLGMPQKAAQPGKVVQECPSAGASTHGPTQTLAEAGGGMAATVSGYTDTAVQLAERWRQEITGWFGEMTRGLQIEFRYPEDYENGPVDRDDRPHPTGEA